MWGCQTGNLVAEPIARDYERMAREKAAVGRSSAQALHHGEYSSVLLRLPSTPGLPSKPPAISTLPLGSSVAVAILRAVFITGVDVDGAKLSEILRLRSRSLTSLRKTNPQSSAWWAALRRRSADLGKSRADRFCQIT